MYKRTVLIPIFILAATAGLFVYKSAIEPQKIVRESDYIEYLSHDNFAANGSLATNQESLAFWEDKLRNEPRSGLYKLKLAALLTRQFKMTGEITLFSRSDSLLQDALSGPLSDPTPYYHALSTNAVTQHDFKRALKYAEMALQTGAEPEISKLHKFDALLELGRLEEARSTLRTYKNKKNFQYLIRKAKIQDQEGNLSAAIQTMEAVAAWCKEVQNQSLTCWTLSNLGDMYSHAGWVRKSYNTYLKVLEIDPSYYYALKGIAWIAYAHDLDVSQASQIADYLLEIKHNPDLFLFKAELAAYKNRAAAE